MILWLQLDLILCTLENPGVFLSQWDQIARDLKGTHARDFHSLFLNFFCIFQSLIKMQYNQHFQKSSSNSPRYSKFWSLPIFAKARNRTEHCRQKLRVKFSIVFVTVRFRIVLSAFSKKVESSLLRRKSEIKLIFVGEDAE